MALANHHEQEFFAALRDIFVGAKVEGESGYINLMKIKARYFTEGVFPQLMQDIDAACQPFEPSFREELFDKLYDFFKRYFSESGSIYFRHTHLDKLYNGIDVAETLSCVTGKWIKRVTRDTVEFADGTTASLTNPDWTMIKPLVWW